MTRRLSAMIAVLVLGVAGNAAAQSAFGLKAGAVLSGLNGGDAGAATEQPGFTGGAFYGIGLASNLAAQIEVLYTAKGVDGFRSRADTLPGLPAARLSMTFAEVPILLRMGYPGETVLLSAFAGPVLSFRLGCRLEPEDGSSDPVNCDDDAAGQRFHPRATDLGATAGLGIDFALGESTFFFDARYTYGLLSIESGDAGLDATHAVAAVMVGFAFPLGR